MADVIYVAPGNAGTALEPDIKNIDIPADDIQALADFADKEGIGLTIVGPEAPLVAGVTDLFASRGLKCFGPSAAAAQLEGSKAFSKDFLARHRIPTAAYGNFDSLEPALAYIRKQGAPIVVKADGLAAGKGVVVALTLADAEQALHDMLGAKALGEASARVVVEEFLEGEEASYIVISDGRHYIPFASSQDHKRRDQGDLGPNTGGMGAYSPAPVVTPEIEERIQREVIEPTLAGMAAEGAPFVGFLYAGVMVAKDGTPKVLEFNVRLGDPETQPIMLRLKSDLLDLIEAALDGRLDKLHAAWDPRPALGVVVAAGGYPGRVRSGDVIEGLEARPAADTKVFHAGTRLDDSGRVLTAGGRVLCVCGIGATVAQAAERAYSATRGIRFAGSFFRPDIGYRAIQRERKP